MRKSGRSQGYASTEAVAPGVGACISAEVVRAFAAGELSDAQIADVDEHIDGCPACRERVLVELGGGGQRTASGELTSGMRLAGRYRVLRFIGRGGMGEVYEVEDETLAERVALKCLAAEFHHARGVELMKAEVQLARKVSHPNVCRVYDVGVEHVPDGAVRYFLTMELLTGEPLSRRLARGALPLEEVASIARQLLLGLREAHRAGVLHRDLKSDNVLFRSAPVAGAERAVVITDFGLSRLVEGGRTHITISTMCVGSAAYMAPEQVEGGRLSPATDLYSFGVVLYELLTGKLPFVADTALATAMMRLRTPAPRPSERRAELSRGWDELVSRCLERDPERRLGSADAALRVLDELTACSTSPRRHGFHIVAALSTGALLAALAFSYAMATRAPAPRALRDVLRGEQPGAPARSVPVPLEAAASAATPGSQCLAGVDPVCTVDAGVTPHASVRRSTHTARARRLAVAGRSSAPAPAAAADPPVVPPAPAETLPSRHAQHDRLLDPFAPAWKADARR